MRSDFYLNTDTILCGAIRLKHFPPSDFSPQIRAEIAPISARTLAENRSAEISDRKLPISASIRHGFFLPSGNRQFLMGENASIRNDLMYYFRHHILIASVVITTMNNTKPHF